MNAKAIFSREMSLSSRWPTCRPIRSRRTVTGLSAITCDLTRNPFFSVGSIVTRKSGASLHSEVIWQITTDACIWLPGDVMDTETDGHVDGYVAYVKPATVLFEVVADPAYPRYPIMAENRKVL